MNDNVIEVFNATKSYSFNNKVLHELDFTLKEGTILGLIGKNGAGKSTLIKGILGLVEFDEGNSKIFGENSFEMSNIIRQKIGYVPQVFTGLRWMRVKFLLDYIGSFYNTWDNSKVDKLIKEWDLDPYKKVSVLSEGERQKLSIIKALGHNPSLLILDEPVASLDPIARRKFIGQLIDMNLTDNRSILFSTHITSDLERVAADIAILTNGKIYFNGELSDLKEKVKRIKIFSQKQLPNQLPFDSVINYEVNDKGAVFTLSDFNNEAISKLEFDYSAKVSVEDLNLEEIFLEMNK